MTPDYILGLQLATSPDHIIREALSDRPSSQALILKLSRMLCGPTPGQLDAFLNPIHRPNPNQRLLSRIVPPPMPRRYRYGSVARLRRMQQEMDGGRS